MGVRDKRTISRTNGQIYAAWGLADSTTDEKVARTRAAMIMRAGLLLDWAENARACTTVIHSRLHRGAIVALGLLGILALALIFIVSPLPSYADLANHREIGRVDFGGVPTVVLLYPAYSVLCIGFSLAALRRPSASARFM